MQLQAESPAEAAGSAERPDPSKLLLRHVVVKPGFEPIAQALLGNVVLTETLAEALALFNQNGKIQTIVTRNGDVVSPRGFLIGGSKDASSGILAKKHELRELERQGKALEQKLESARLEQRSIEAEFRHLDVELQKLIEQKNQGRENEIEAEKAIYKAAEELKGLLEKEYYYRATVIIGLDQASKILGKVYVLGPVRNQGPVEIPANETFTAGKAILRAGGFGDFVVPAFVGANFNTPFQFLWGSS